MASLSLHLASINATSTRAIPFCSQVGIIARIWRGHANIHHFRRCFDSKYFSKIICNRSINVSTPIDTNSWRFRKSQSRYLFNVQQLQLGLWNGRNQFSGSIAPLFTPVANRFEWNPGDGKINWRFSYDTYLAAAGFCVTSSNLSALHNVRCWPINGSG